LESFEELGVAPEVVEALAAEGIEAPTPLQQTALPLLRKGNNLVMAAGPGSGLLLAWLVALVERVEPEGGGTRALVLTASSESAERLAESAARLLSTTGHSVAALGSSWVLPQRAHFLFGTPADVLTETTSGMLSLDAVTALVIDQAQLIDASVGLERVERVIDYLPEGAQRILSALPMTPAASDFAARHLKRTVTIPASPDTDVPKRGVVRFRIAPEPREAAVLDVVAELLEGGARHALAFSRSEDRAADIGDYLTLRGYAAGAPGDESVPVWLGVEPLDARASASGIDGVVVVSCDVPADPDTLDRRHAIATGGVVVVLPREVAHLRALGRETGYDTVPFPPPRRDTPDSVRALRISIEQALDEEDTGPYLLALEPLFERHDPAEVAAAATALLRKKALAVPAHVEPTSRAAPQAGATPSWAKLFVGVGERDGLRPGDLLGAITGETGVPGTAVGRIDIKESHSLVEVHDSVARKVIQAINGTTIKGRAVRADYDRPRRGGHKRPGRRP
jgi:ATP-dependent RNA helicase DeaD